MRDTVLLDIDAVLLERVRRLASAKGWGQQEAMIHLLEHGLFACEVEVAARLDATDAGALQAAIAAMEQIDNDPGFALIGRVGAPDAAADAAKPENDVPSAGRKS